MSSPEENIMALLKERQTPHEVIEHAPVLTNAAMAEALGVPLADTVKNIMLETTEGEIILVVLPGDQRFDSKRLAAKVGTKRVTFAKPELCATCKERTCIEICSAQALMPGEEGAAPEFDREKCIHCGACIWSCSKALPEDRERANIEFAAGSGGLHSNEN